MSIAVMSYVWANSTAKGGSLLVLLALADRADDGGRAFPGIAEIAAKSRLSERAVRYIFRDLVEVGELGIVVSAGPHGTNQYRVFPGVHRFHRSGGEARIAPPGGGKDCRGGAKIAGGGQRLPPRGEEKIAGGRKPASPNTSVKEEQLIRLKQKREKEAVPPTAAGPPTDEQRILSLSFPHGWSEKQKTAVLTAADLGRREGVPWPWMAHAVVSKKIRGLPEPWKRIDRAIADAQAYAFAASAGAKRFRDLEHLVEYVSAGGDGLPSVIRGVGLAKIVRQATEWP